VPDLGKCLNAERISFRQASRIALGPTFVAVVFRSLGFHYGRTAAEVTNPPAGIAMRLAAKPMRIFLALEPFFHVNLEGNAGGKSAVRNRLSG
jgi:hypothetical protein